MQAGLPAGLGVDDDAGEAGPLRMLVVSHGGLIHTLLGLVAETQGKPMVNNCSITRIALTPPARADSRAGGGGEGGGRCGVRLIEANSTAHLGEHMSESTW
jgi:broad specificity phosphatase PhoE